MAWKAESRKFTHSSSYTVFTLLFDCLSSLILSSSIIIIIIVAPLAPSQVLGNLHALCWAPSNSGSSPTTMVLAVTEVSGKDRIQLTTRQQTAVFKCPDKMGDL